MTVVWRGPEFERRIRQAALAGVVTAIGIVETRAVELIVNPPKTGVKYRRRGVVHQASRAGEAPASDTGTLVNSRRIDFNPDQLSASLNFSAKYAWWLERGTKDMEPRPFARRALMETREETKAAIMGSIRMALR